MSVEKLPVVSDSLDQSMTPTDAENNAFSRLTEGLDIDTDGIIADEARKAAEAARVAKLTELNVYLDNPEDRRRGLKAIFNEDAEKIDAMTTTEVETFIKDRLLSKSKELAPSHQQEIPVDTELYNINDLENDASTLGLRDKVMSKFGLIKGAGFGGNVLLAATQLAGRREEKQAKRQAKIDRMNPSEREAYLRRNRAIVTLSTIAIGVAYGLMRSRGMLVGESNAHSTTADIALAVAEHSNSTSADLYDINSYNNSDSSFYDFANKEHRGDFGPSVLADADPAKDTVNGNYNPGFADWMSRHKHEPNGLANLRVGLGLEGDDTSFARRNEVADMLNGDMNALRDADKSLVEALNDPDQFTVETISIDQPYTTTYMTDANGDPIIGVEQHVDYGGEAFKITNVATGEVTFWRKGCGADQQIWLEAVAPAQEQAPAGGGTAPRAEYAWAPSTSRVEAQPTEQAPVGDGDPVAPATPATPATPHVPVQPVTPTTPTIPGGGGGTTPGGGGPIPGGGDTTPGGETYDPTKIYTGGTETAEGIDPSLNGFVEDTQDPLEADNGTGSGNQNADTVPNAEAAGVTASDAEANTLPQVDTPETGAGTNRTQTDLAERQQQAKAEAEQAAANAKARNAEAAASASGATDRNVANEQAGMDANGRPRGASNASNDPSSTSPSASGETEN